MKLSQKISLAQLIAGPIPGPIKRTIRKSVDTYSDHLCSLSYSVEAEILTDMTASEKRRIMNLAKRRKGTAYLEIGSYLGASACFIAMGIRKSRRPAKLYCVDTWKNDGMSEGKRDTFTQFCINTASYSDIIVPLRGPSVDVAKTFEHSIDFLFIDGDHSYDGVKADVDNWFPKLKPGAVVLFHDTGWAQGVQRVVREEVAPRARYMGRLPNLRWFYL